MQRLTPQLPCTAATLSVRPLPSCLLTGCLSLLCVQGVLLGLLPWQACQSVLLPQVQHLQVLS